MRRFGVNKIARWALGILALLMVVLLVYFFVPWRPEALERLKPLAAKLNYAALERAVAANVVGPSGFRFVVLGDTRSNTAAAVTVLGQAAGEHPVFIVNTGDTVRHGTVEEFLDDYMKLVEAVPMPQIPVPGNHDEGPNRNFAAFKALFGSTRFSFDYGGCRFVGFNNGDWLGVDGTDLKYLETELAKPGASYKFVFFHQPPDYVQASGRRGFSWHAKEFRRLMKANGVTEVFMGHIHGYATEVIDGIRYTITGGGGAPLATAELGPEGGVLNLVTVTVGGGQVTQDVVRLIEGEWKRSAIP